MTRDEQSALLPFYANDTLAGDERAALERALDTDPSLASELAALMAIRQTMQDEPVSSLGEFGVARLMRDTAAEPNVKTTPFTDHIWKIAAAVLLAVVVGQFVFLSSPVETPEGYNLVGGAQADFVVTFAPTTSESDMRELMLSAGVEFVSGPSALGVYHLGVTSGNAQDALAILTDAPAIETVQSSGE